MASRYNNKRIVKSFQTIGQGRLLPGMIITFNYSEPGVMDPRPILLYLNTDKKSKNIVYNNIYRFDIIKSSQHSRQTWLHLSDNLPGYGQNEIQVAPKDRV
mgnify:CR=1 FL=1